LFAHEFISLAARSPHFHPGWAAFGHNPFGIMALAAAHPVPGIGLLLFVFLIILYEGNIVQIDEVRHLKLQYGSLPVTIS
jgi:hypothetical protein